MNKVILISIDRMRPYRLLKHGNEFMGKENQGILEIKEKRRIPITKAVERFWS